MRILTDADIDRVPLAPLIAAVRAQIVADAEGGAVAPPRHISPFGDGGLVFTIGGNAELAGFRAYQTFQKPGHDADDQVIAAWDRTNGEMLGLAVGNRLGALRTGCIGASAADILAPSRAEILAVIGVGRQAETQLLAVASVRPFATIRVCGRRHKSVEDFALRMAGMLGRPVQPLTDIRAAVEDADVVVLATTATAPVVEAGWIKPTAHVTTIGPSTKAAHELPLDLASRARVIVTDSPRQIAAMGDTHMLAGGPDNARIEHLGTLATGFDPDADRGLTLFLSIGLAGTEVACLAAALDALPR